jgi:hypothetical protein
LAESPELDLGRVPLDSYEICENSVIEIRNKGWNARVTLDVPDIFDNVVKIVDNNFYNSSGTKIGYYDTSKIICG